MTNGFRAALVASVAVTCALPNLAVAQANAPDSPEAATQPLPDQSADLPDEFALSSESGEIMVTASRRSENIQDVPLSITAISGEALTSKAATQFFDYASSVPNLSFAVSGLGPSSARSIAIRGISDNNTTGFYIDDSPLSESLDPRILDVERIEVLRGPQGTLYGARSLGGTVRLITIQPNAREYSGRLHAAVSTTRNTDRLNYAIDGAINVPIVSDRVGLRVVGIHQYDAGYFSRTFDTTTGGTVTTRNVGRSETSGGSAAMILHISDDLSITPRILYQETHLNGFLLADVPVDNTSTQPNILSVQSLDQRRPFDIPELSVDKWWLGTVDVKLDRSYGTFSSATTLFRRRTRDLEDETDFIAAAFGLTTPLAAEIDVFSPVNSFSQELRFASSFDGPVQIVSGLFYNNLRTSQEYPPNIVPGLDAAFGGALGTEFLHEKHWPTKQKDYAIYGEVNWELAPGLTAILGGRAFKVETTSSISVDGLVFGGPDSRPESTLTESGIVPKASLQYEFSRGNQVYATAAQGYRPGGSNEIFPEFLGCRDELAPLGLTPDSAAFYRSDSVWSYEVGAKTTLFDRRLRASAAAFQIDWDDIQQKVTLQCGFVFKNNAGAARSRGFEFEITADPAEGLTFSAGAGYTDAEFTESVTGSKFKDGDRVPQVPRWNVNLSGDYRRPLGSSMELFLHADYAYTSGSDSAVNANVNPATGRLVPRIRPSYEVINARVGVSIDERYEIALFAKNLTDERASLSDITPVAVETPGRARVTINQPRTIGAELRYTF